MLDILNKNLSIVGINESSEEVDSIVKPIKHYLSKYLADRKKNARKKGRKRNLSKNEYNGNISKLFDKDDKGG